MYHSVDTAPTIGFPVMPENSLTAYMDTATAKPC